MKLKNCSKQQDLLYEKYTNQILGILNLFLLKNKFINYGA